MELNNPSLPNWSASRAKNIMYCHLRKAEKEPNNPYLTFMYQFADKVRRQRGYELWVITHANLFAEEAHGAQKRKYTDEPYIVHPEEVSEIVLKYTGDVLSAVAALLHDVLEDTTRTYDDIKDKFGVEVADLVMEVTDPSKPEDGNRAARKAIDLVHIAKGSARSHNIKLADILSNIKSIAEYDHDFALVYIAEKEAQLEVLVRGDAKLRAKVQEVINQTKMDLHLRGK